MKILRLQLPREFVEILGLGSIFKHVDRLEIINAYQYDQKHFFSMQRIVFNPVLGMENMDMDEIREYITKQFGVTDLDLMEHSKNMLLLMMKQRREEGFWPVMFQGPWAFLFPITVDPERILLTVFTSDKYIKQLKNVLSRLTKNVGNYEILAQTTMKAMTQIGLANVPIPDFTKRQREISEYAARKGYFQSPKKISASELAEHFDISVSAVNEHLRKAEQLAMKFFFGEST